MIKISDPFEYKYKKTKRVIFIKSFSLTCGEISSKLRKTFARASMRGNGKQKKLLRVLSLLLCAVMIGTLVLKTYRKAEPIALSALENVVGGWLEETVISAVKCELEEHSYTWDDFCIKIIASDGSIASISANTASISVICADVVTRINSDVRREKYIRIPVPIGSIVAPKYLSGKGFRINVRAVPYVSVSARISSEMQEAGINQTLHRINMTVISDVQVICMSESVSFRRESVVILAESLIVGKIPIVS